MTRHYINAKVWAKGADGETEPLVFEDVNYVSFVNNNTFGPPPVLAEQKSQTLKQNIVAEIEEHGDVTVLYINNENTLAAEIERRA